MDLVDVVNKSLSAGCHYFDNRTMGMFGQSIADFRLVEDVDGACYVVSDTEGKFLGWGPIRKLSVGKVEENGWISPVGDETERERIAEIGKAVPHA